MKTQKDIKEILDEMQKLFGDYPPTELFYETPFQLLVAVMLSAQTTDKQVNKVTKTLFETIKTPADVLEMWLEKFGQAISSIGLRRGKAKNIVETARLLIERWSQMKKDEVGWKKMKSDEKIWNQMKLDEVRWKDSFSSLGEGRPSLPAPLPTTPRTSSLGEGSPLGYWMPDSLEEMVALPGVGIKTAKVVLYVLYKQRWVAVDTHVHRVMNRLWIVHTKTPEQSSKALEKIIPDEYKDIAHHVIIYFGRYLCKARKPECSRCPLVKMCKRVKDYNLESSEGSEEFRVKKRVSV